MIRLFLCAAFTICLATSIAHAEKKRQECKAVEALARVDYDSSLNLNWFEDTERHLCFFTIAGTGQQSADIAMKEASTFVNQLFKGGSDVIPANAVDAVFNTFVIPITDKELQNEQLDKFWGALKERVQIIEQCITILSSEKAEYKPIDEVVSCGVNNDKTAFIITASTLGFTLGLQLALS